MIAADEGNGTCPRDPFRRARVAPGIVRPRDRERTSRPAKRARHDRSVRVPRVKVARGAALYYFTYNFIKIHGTLRTTPAMAAGVTDRLREVSDLVALLEASERRLERAA